MDDNYDVVIIQQLQGNTSLTFEQCVLRIRTCNQELESSAGKAINPRPTRTRYEMRTINCHLEMSPKSQDLSFRKLNSQMTDKTF
jgi:hypothetical protein